MQRKLLRAFHRSLWVGALISTWMTIGVQSPAAHPRFRDSTQPTRHRYSNIPAPIASLGISIRYESSEQENAWSRLPTNPRPEYRLAGEFEQQRGLMLSCSSISTASGIRDAIRASAKSVPIVALYGSEGELESAKYALTEAGIRHDAVRYVFLPHDTIWTRDYGPVALSGRTGSQAMLLDTQYPTDGRENDDQVPHEFARSAGLPISTVPWNIDGGNVLSNGRGLLITTTRLLDENPELDQSTLKKVLSAYYGATRVVILESLVDEPTGHVDMFATFTSSDCVVMGKYDPNDDPENARILNRNAKRLASVRLKSGRLKVRRIHMPSKSDGVWRTYTNVIYANRVLLMPVYSNTQARLRQHAIRSYQALLPGWTIVPINADDLIEFGGALHCVIMNLGPIPPHRLEWDRSFRTPVEFSYNESDYLLK